MKTVLITGTFDILHLGHIYFFKQAREYGDNLHVIIARDSNVEKIKGHKPVNTEDERLDLLSYVKLVDKVILGDEDNPYKYIEELQPDVIALGYDQNVFVDKLENFLKEKNIDAEIVRLKPHREDRLKSGRIKDYIESNI